MEASTLEALINFCYSGLTKITDDNVLSILPAACRLQFNEVQEVSGNEEFNYLSVERLVDLISHEELNVRSEEQVYLAVARWVRFNLPDRKQFLAKVQAMFSLMEHVRLPLCQPKFLVSTVSKDALVMADVTCRNLLDEAKNHQLLQLSTYERPVMQGTLTRPRKSLSFGE
ncbi:BTB And Kelch, partial [Cooperia oncophora]